MRALRFHEFGGPSNLRLTELPDPRPGADTAVIRVVAASVNPSDVKNVAGQMEGTVLPRVPGRDFSGVVESGPREWMGAEVWGTGGEIGFSVDGTHAERLAFPIAGLVRKPRNLDHDVASAAGVTFVIAWLGAMTYAGARAGETVVVVGAGGGVGGAAIQIVKAAGCRVIGVDRGSPPPPPAGDLIDEFVSSEGDVPSEIKKRTSGKGAEVVFDAVGGVMFEASLLARESRAARRHRQHGQASRRIRCDRFLPYGGADPRRGQPQAGRGRVREDPRGSGCGVRGRPVSAADDRGEIPLVDARDEEAIDKHLESAIRKAGRVDVSFTAVGIPDQKLLGCRRSRSTSSNSSCRSRTTRRRTS